MATTACGQSAASRGSGKRSRPPAVSASRVPSATGSFRPGRRLPWCQRKHPHDHGVSIRFDFKPPLLAIVKPDLSPGGRQRLVQQAIEGSGEVLDSGPAVAPRCCSRIGRTAPLQVCVCGGQQLRREEGGIGEGQLLQLPGRIQGRAGVRCGGQFPVGRHRPQRQPGGRKRARKPRDHFIEPPCCQQPAGYALRLRQRCLREPSRPGRRAIPHHPRFRPGPRGLFFFQPHGCLLSCGIGQPGQLPVLLGQPRHPLPPQPQRTDA